MSIWLSIELSGTRWAITHNRGILGYAKTEVEAWSLVESLAGYPSQSLSDLDRSPRRFRRMPKFNYGKHPIALLVKQEPLDGVELANQLAEMELTVVAANDAAEAILILDSHPEIELLLIDMWMPGGSMDGLQMAHQVRRRWPTLKIIVISELIDVELSDLPLDSIFLARPCGPEVLMDALAHMIIGRATSSSPVAAFRLLAA
jgi:CheY-like chemotaxis protein